ncbi:MAG: hypothetical protein LUH11_03710 [Candidatus Gastranaerophilales bacterium]|nr:hypothetical protein [Candidatus Gastranaerophilales bacterium]
MEDVISDDTLTLSNENLDNNQDNNSDVNKVTDENSDNTTSKEDVIDDNDKTNSEFYLGTYKTKEAAEAGLKSAQAKITEQGNKIKELENKLNINDVNSIPDINKQIANVRQKVNSEYGEMLKGLGYKYSSYLPQDIEYQNINDIVANLPPVQASQFTAEFMNIQNQCNNRINTEIQNVYKNFNQKYQEIKANDKERFKNNEIAFNAWYNPPKTIDEVAQLIETVQKQAIENYIKEQAAKKEDETHKNKLSTTANTNNKNFTAEHIFTRNEIAKLSDKEFAKYEAQISAQVAAGLIKE